MSAVVLPASLTRLGRVDGEVACKVGLDLTVYLAGPSQAELDHLLGIYSALCPPDRLTRYTITELDYWADVAEPVLTDSGRAAARAGRPDAALEPVRRRLRDGRAFDVGYWDGREIDDPAGSWSLRCHRILRRSTGSHAFARIMMPLDTDPRLLLRASHMLADNVRLLSGHGGLVFAQDPWLSEDAFDLIYALARRFWGVDIDDMNDTLPLMSNAIKGVSWLTLLGRELMADQAIGKVAAALSNVPDVRLVPARHGLVITAGAAPSALDQHRDDPAMASYRAIAEALADRFPTEHADFPGERFIDNDNTVGWLRRFLEPAGWR